MSLIDALPYNPAAAQPPSASSNASTNAVTSVPSTVADISNASATLYNTGYFIGYLFVIGLLGAILYSSLPNRIKNRRYTITERVGTFLIVPGIAIWGFFTFLLPAYQPSINDNALISGSARDVYMQGAIQGCVNHSTSIPQNVGVSAGVINRYCTCVANGTADLFTNGDIKNFGNNNDGLAAKYKVQLEAVSVACTK
jgi:hypothetical protein